MRHSDPNPTPGFPAVVDNTIVETWYACEGKAQMQYFDHWAPEVNTNLHFGGAFAEGMKAARNAFYRDGATDDDAIAIGMLAAMEFYGTHVPPQDSNKTFFGVGRAVADYFFQYPLAEDVIQPYVPPTGIPAVEFNFAIPLPINHPETGEPLIYAGRADMIGRYNDSIFVVDEKTTTSLGASWERQWEMAGQFTGYTWAAQEHGYPVAGAIVRGISILTNFRFGHAQVISDRRSYQIKTWYTQLLKKLTRMVEAYSDWKKTGDLQSYQFSHGAACKSYGGCPFAKVCRSENPQKVLEVYFVRRKWDPLFLGEDA